LPYSLKICCLLVVLLCGFSANGLSETTFFDSKKLEARSLLKQGQSLARNQKDHKAADTFIEAIKLHPNWDLAHYELGAVRFQMGVYQQAIASLVRANTLNPDLWEAHFTLAQVYEKLNKPKFAIKQYQNVVKIHPDHPESHFSLGILWDQAEKSENAVAHYKEVIRIRPTSSEAWYNLGLVYTRREIPEEAEVAFQNAIQFKPDYPEAHLALGMIHEAFDDLEPPIYHIRKAQEQFEARKDIFRAQLAKLQLSGLESRLSDPEFSTGK